jgi:hypothetical protein
MIMHDFPLPTDDEVEEKLKDWISARSVQNKDLMLRYEVILTGMFIVRNRYPTPQVA